ncbi:MAG: efflux RND transporter permease subunit [Burkholderiaceae bacterium]
MARFFIDRPVFAWVIAIVIMLAGLLAIFSLPVSQYPQIAPPSVTINANYPGASAATLQDTVTQVIEQRMTGIDGLRYMKSTSDSTGRATVTLTFDAGTDPDIAQVQVQNKLSLAIPVLPQEVQRQGVQVNKSTAAFLMVISLISDNPDITQTDLADYIVTNIQDPISRVPGVGELQVFGAGYAMRIWLDPERLQNFALTPADVKSAILAQNAQVSAGELGGAPAVPGQELNATITSQTRLQTPEQFRAILLRTTSDGAVVRLGDVARVELGSEQYNFVPRYNGKPATGVAIRLASGANALDTADLVKAEMERLAESFPQGLEWLIPFDTTPFVKLSIESVVMTLIEAIVLVFLVMYLFLQNFRATLIPAIAVPVVLLGTFGVLSAAGFSINTLTMFAMVLAIGLLVDDAIVVVENVERIMSEEGLSPREATRKSMGQITGALVGITLVLSAVFVPMAFFGGSTGVIYRQFSITIVSAMALSVLVALVLTPALCATMLKPIEKGHQGKTRGFFGWFNRGFERSNRGYQSTVGYILARTGRFLLIYLVIVGVVVFMFGRMPTAFLPDEDQGVLLTQVQLPAGATQERTLEVLDKVQEHFLENEKEAVESVFTVAGFSFGGTGQNMGLGFVRLKDWEERPGEALEAQSVAGRAMGAFMQMRDAMAFAFAPPPIPELGIATGFNFFLQDQAGVGRDVLLAARDQFLGMAAQDPDMTGVRPNAQPDTPQYHIEVDTAAAGALGLTMAEINDALSTAWGGTYVNDFIDKGRVKRVFVQADAQFRMMPEDLDRWYVRSSRGEMVPFSAFASARWTSGAPRLERYNGLPALEILGEAAPGKSTGDAMAAVERIAAQLPDGVGISWTGLSYEERQTGDQAPLLYVLSLLVVFLCLAALYESWSIPFSVMLIVPLGILGALLASSSRGLSNDVYFQVALLATVGLSAKNAILIVEFAKAQIEQGLGLIEATLEAVKLRLRPIIMTSLAFALGVVPLAISTGAGSGSQNAIGTGVLGGTIAGTLLSIFFVPLFFVVVRRIFGRDSKRVAAEPPIDA